MKLGHWIVRGMSLISNDSDLQDEAGVDPRSVLVAIPTLNEDAHIEACVMSLIEGDPFAAEVRIVVADGGSEDNTVETVKALSQRFPNLKVIDNPGRIQAAAINAVVETQAEPEHVFLVRCDAHSIYPPGYVRDVVQSLSVRPEAAAVGTAMDAIGEGCLQRAAAWIVDTPFGSGGSAHRGGTESGWVDHAHHAGFRLEWFQRVGGYDIAFRQNEDAELDHRIGLVGGRIWLDADIRLNYSMRNTLRGLWRQYWLYGRGRAQNILKHRSRPRLRQMLPVAAVIGIVASICLSLVWPPAIWLAASYFAVAVLVSVFGVLATKSPCGLYAGPAMAAMHLGWGLGFISQVAGVRT